MRSSFNGFFRRRPVCTGRPRGFTLIESLVASLIMACSVIAMISLWRFTFSLTVKSDDVGAGYLIGRRAMERVKLAGFDFAPEGANTLYYDRQGGSESAAKSTQHQLRAVTSITSDAGYPSYNAARQVIITVTLLSTGETVYQTGATLTKKGI